MEYEVNKSLNIFMLLSKILFVLIIISNVFSPVYNVSSTVRNIIHFLVILFWIKGLLGCLGYLKKVVAREENGTIRYEVSVPFLPVFILRIIEALYGVLRKAISINLIWFGLCLFLDTVFLFVLLFNKSNYYYESIEE